MHRDRLSLRLGKAVSIRAVCATLGILALSALGFTAVSTKTTLDRRAHYVQHMLERAVTSVDALAIRVNEEQDFYLWITPPDPEFILRQPVGVVAFDAKGFPEEFVSALVPATAEGCPIYTVTVDEDPFTRDLVVYNADGKAIYAIHPYEGYDPFRLLNQLHPDLSTSRYAPAYAAWLKACYDPARVQIVLELIPTEWIEAHAEDRFATLAEKAASSLGLSGGGGVTMMRSQAALSNLVFDAISPSPTGTVLEIGHPDTFTGRVEVYTCTDLVAAAWAVAATNLATNGTGTIYWTDTGATNADATLRFYAAADGTVDSDGDGIGDGRERFIYHTTETNRDSDLDGLVDGFSGVVSTNVYPAGATTNGGQFIEGELTWHTDAQLPDTDDDGMEDGWEVSHGHNPTNWNDPPNVRGTVTYAGHQTGAVWVVAVTSSNSWSTNASALVNAFHGYRIPHLESTNYWIHAWMDSNDSGTNDAAEARGTYAAAALVITNRVLGIDFVLTDPDDDSDGLPDYWEVAHFGSITNYTGTDDSDDDEYTNFEEYEAQTDPLDDTSHPWLISGTVTYAGPQDGTIVVLASTVDGWSTNFSVAISEDGTYTLTHLPPNTNYWVKAWRDSNGDGSNTFWEARGSHGETPLYLDANLTNVTITLTDPDNDEDGLPDWWEFSYGLDPFNAPPPDAAWWKLDETGGTNVPDSTGNANQGVVSNASSSSPWVTGVISNGLALDGTNYVQLGDSASLKPDYVSVAGWVRPSRDYTNAPGGGAVLFSKKAPGAATGYSLSYEGGALKFLICASGAKTVSFPCALTNGIWVHVAGTYSGSSQALYLDGVLKCVTNYNWGIDSSVINQGTTPACMGASTDAAASNRFAGVLDDMRVYSWGLASNEVHGAYELGADPDHDGLSNWWEYQKGTCPTNSDTDGDGLSDYEETHLSGLNPTNAADGLAMRESARAQIVRHWAFIFPDPLVFTNAPGTTADVNDMATALSALSDAFHKMGAQ